MKRTTSEPVLVGAVLLVAFLLRMWGFTYDLPCIYHPDEPRYVEVIQRIFVTGDLNPHFFNYPSLFFYVNALAYLPYYFAGKLIGVFHARTDIMPPLSLAMGVTTTVMPSTIVLGRLVSICAGTVTVGLVHLVGTQISRRMAVGVLASLMVAVLPAGVWHSRSITPDTFVTLFAVATLLVTILAYQRGRLWHYCLAGFLVGMTASTKYNGVLILLPLLVAFLLRRREHRLNGKKLVLILALCVVGFVAATPYAILDPLNFLRSVRFESRHYATGHIGMEGNSLAWYLNYMWSTGGVLYVLFVLGTVLGLLRRTGETCLLVSFPITYFVFISRFVVRNDRTLLPLIPFVVLMTMWFLVRSLDTICGLRRKWLRVLLLIGLAALMIPLWRVPVSRTLSDTRDLLRVDSRTTARAWIEENLPGGAMIAIESYAPYVDPSRFVVRSFVTIIEHEPEWYRDQGFDYLVLSQGMYGRFYQDLREYGVESSKYDRLFRRFDPVKVFDDGGYEVRIYKVE